MPSKAYGKFQKNLETVQRLNITYETMKENRHSKGRGAFDHITRSAIVFLVSAFEVYCEDVLVPSRVMRKLVCRFWLNEVSRQ